MVYVLITLGVVVLLLVGAILAIRKGASSARQRIAERLDGLDVERSSKANFYGTTSRGAGQVRGLGTLVLTPDEVVFLQLIPSYELRIPRAAITGTSVARSFLGKTQGRDLLVIEWAVEGDAGSTSQTTTDSVAFDIPELDGWRSALG